MSSRNSMGENVDWIQLAQGMKLCLPAINTVMKPHLNPLALELDIYSSAHHLCKM